ncbi:unnamed protein product [Prunus armeniaca]
METKANVEETSKQKFKKNKGKKVAKNFANGHAPKGKDFKKIKGHKAQDCGHQRDQNPTNPQANVTEVNEDFVAVMSETNMVSDTKDWNSGGEKLYVGKDFVSAIEGKGSVLLKFTSGKFILTKGGMFVGKGYHADGLFKLNVTSNDAFNNMNTNDASRFIA